MNRLALILKIILLILFFALGISCEREKSNFKLYGIVSNFPNGEKLYLKGHDILDSTQVKNGAFRFDTKLDSTPIKLNLFTKNFEQYRFFLGGR